MVSSQLLKIIHFSETERWNVKYFFSTQVVSQYPISNIGKHTIHITKKTKLSNEPEKEFKILGISNEVGMFDAYTELGKNINQPYIYVENGCIAYNPYRINVGSIGLKTSHLKNEFISPAYVVFKCKNTVLPDYLYLVMKSCFFNNLIKENTTGSVRQTLSYENLSQIKIPIPDLPIQKQLVKKYKYKLTEAQNFEAKLQNKKLELEKFVFSELGIKSFQVKSSTNLLQTISFKDVFFWGYDKLLNKLPYTFEKYKAYNFNNKPSWLKEIYRGKSPKYANSNIVMLNQKCNRTNSIDLSFAKSIDVSWFNSIDKKCLTQENDILINSTGEGTIGRASLIKKEYAGYAYDSHLLLIKVNLKEVNPELVVYLINSKYGQNQVQIYKSAQATKQTELGIENTKKILFPLPDIERQDKLALHIREQENEMYLLSKNITYLRESAKKEFEEAIFGE